MDCLSEEVVGLMVMDVVTRKSAGENDAKTIAAEISKQIGEENMTPDILEIIASNLKKVHSMQKSKPHITVFDDDTFLLQFRKPEVIKYYVPRFEDFTDESIELDTMGRITSEEKVLELSTKKRRESEGNIEEDSVQGDQPSEMSDDDDSTEAKDNLQADVQCLINFAKKRPRAKNFLRGIKNIKSLAEKKRVLIARLHDAGYSWKGEVPNSQDAQKPANKKKVSRPKKQRRSYSIEKESDSF